MMRAIRFSAQLDYRIDEDTREGIRLLAPNLQKVSAERIRVELEKLLLSEHPEELKEAYELGLLRQFLPELSEFSKAETGIRRDGNAEERCGESAVSRDSA